MRKLKKKKNMIHTKENDYLVTFGVCHKTPWAFIALLFKF